MKQTFALFWISGNTKKAQQGDCWSLSWLNENILYNFYTETWLEKEIMAYGGMLPQNHHVNALYKTTLVLLWLKY